MARPAPRRAHYWITETGGMVGRYFRLTACPSRLSSSPPPRHRAASRQTR
jgi:hypothetical protein